MECRSRTTPEQFAAILEFMERHGDVGRPQQTARARIKADHRWQQLVEVLNSIDGGVIRPIEKWKKVWADWKTKTKKKRNNGGGSSNLTTFEERVLGVMGLSAVDGFTKIEKRGFDDLSFDKPTEPHHANGQTSATEFLLDFIPTPSVATGSAAEPTTTPSVLSPPATEIPDQTRPMAMQRRPRLLRACRRITPFERSNAEFVAVEHRRLKLEETRERNFHEREIQKLHLESRRIEMEENRNTIFKSIADNINNLPNTIIQLLRPLSQAASDIISKKT